MHNKLKLILFVAISWLLASSVEILTQKITLENYYREKFEILINRIIPKDQYLVNVDITLSEGSIRGGTKETKYAQKLEKKTSAPQIKEEKEEQSVVSEEEDFFDLFGNDKSEEEKEIEEKVEEKNTYNSNNNKQATQDKIIENTEEPALENLFISVYLDPSASTKQTQIKEILCESIYVQSTESCIDCECINFNVLDSGMGLSEKKEGAIEDSGTSENVLKEYELLIEQMRDDREREEAERITKETKKLEKELKSIENLYESLRTQNKQEDSTKLAYYERKDRDLQRKRDSLLVVLEDKTEQARIAYYQQGQDFQEKQFAVMMEMVKMKTDGDKAAPEQGRMRGEYNPRPPYKNENSSNWMLILILLILFGGFIGVFFAIRQKPNPVYLKPKAKSKTKETDGQNKEEEISTSKQAQQIVAPAKEESTPSGQNNDILKSEVKTLRQSAVSMSVGQKEAATKIIQDWLDEPTDEQGQDNNNQGESEKEE